MEAPDAENAIKAAIVKYDVPEAQRARLAAYRIG